MKLYTHGYLLPCIRWKNKGSTQMSSKKGLSKWIFVCSCAHSHMDMWPLKRMMQMYRHWQRAMTEECWEIKKQASQLENIVSGITTCAYSYIPAFNNGNLWRWQYEIFSLSRGTIPYCLTILQHARSGPLRHLLCPSAWKKMHCQVNILYGESERRLWPGPLMGKLMVALGKDKERNQVTRVSTCAVFLTCAIICKHKINFICLIFMLYKALEQKNRCFLRIEFSFPHESLSVSQVGMSLESKVRVLNQTVPSASIGASNWVI